MIKDWMPPFAEHDRKGGRSMTKKRSSISVSKFTAKAIVTTAGCFSEFHDSKVV